MKFFKYQTTKQKSPFKEVVTDNSPYKEEWIDKNDKIVHEFKYCKKPKKKS